MTNRALFEKLYYSYFPRRRILPVKGYYKSLAFDFKHYSLRDKDVLDFGCGSGFFSLYAALIAAADRVVSIDEFKGEGGPAENYDRLCFLLERLKLTNKINLIKADGVSYDFGGQTFDVIYCSYSLHHIFPKTRQDNSVTIIRFFKKLHAILNPGGRLIIHEIMRHNFAEYLPRRFHFFRINWKTKRDATEWKLYSHKAGFKQVITRYYVPFYFDYLPFRLILSNKLASFFLTSRYVLECK